ncbi:MAG: LptA/OstA family protein, partial [Thermostichus sp. DG_1_6_bins_120]
MKGVLLLSLGLGSVLLGLGADAAVGLPEISQVVHSPGSLDPDTLRTLAARTLQLRSDRQTFDRRAEVFEAEGNVEMRLGRSVLRADRMRIELRQRRAVAEGNVSIELDQQRIQGSRLDYNFEQEQGSLFDAFGQVDIRNLGFNLQRGSQATALGPERWVRF